MSKIIKTATGASYRLVQRTSEDGRHTYEEIEPEINLATKAGITEATKIPEETITRAEAIVTELSSQFPQFVETEIERLRVHAEALTGASNKEVMREEADAIFHSAHELKGLGGSFGFNLVTRIGASLCCLMKQATVFDAQIFAAIDVHIDAVALIVNESVENLEEPKTIQLVSEVEALTFHLVGPEKDS